MLEAFSDEALLALLARGGPREKEEALKVLFKRYAPSFLGLFRRMGLDRATGEDLVQEAFVRVYERAGSFDPRRAPARTWLLSLAHHLAVDELRRRRARPRLLEPDPEEAEAAFDLPGERLDEEAALDRVRLGEALKVLSPEERAVIQALFYEGYTHEEAAQRLGLPLGTVKTRARRALLKLKEVLREP
ncbi:sigma-70 family RNA polymerase sigma factor [Thermus filiformis]|uniref:RNA polymerase sigma E protein n=1 Tax=Thermus filiformis TaxID=276 RepID=A0A0A2WM40_THEFI|nr:sigma-70 family RNA polymerase sigma factor [Thermus filiformis]KGQ21226.1 RNA polymerase sigma E protein [Thermus filiformis]